jgi:putative transposase
MCFLWNKFLAINLFRLNNQHLIMRYHEMDFCSKLYKKSEKFCFLKACPAHTLQQKLKDLNHDSWIVLTKLSQISKCLVTRKRPAPYSDFPSGVV